MTKFIVVTWSYNYHNSKNIKQLMEQIFPLSFELVNDGQQLNITAFDTQARIRNIEIAPVPAVAIVNYINSSAKDNHSSGIIRKCYPPALICIPLTIRLSTEWYQSQAPMIYPVSPLTAATSLSIMSICRL